MGMVYTATFDAVAVTAVTDMFALVAPSDAVIFIHGIRIGQSSDAGDDEAELLKVRISRYTGTVGSGGTTPTPRPHEEGFPAAGTTVRANDTTQATTTTLLYTEVFNVQAGLLYLPTPEERIVISPSGKLVVDCSAPTDSLTMSGSITFEEIGG